MANHKSAAKAHTSSLKNRDRNQSILSRIKTFIKKFEESLLKKDPEATKIAAIKAESELMRGVSKGVLNKKAASRKVSRLVKKTKISA